jgi:hypothetical protein
MQFSLSLSIAAANPADLAIRVAQPDGWAGFRKDLENHAFSFAQQIEIPGENFQVGVGEALLFSNSPQIEQEFLRDSGDRLLGILKGISDPSALIQTAFVAVLSRPPQPEETEAIAAYLASRADRPVPALQQMLWSLVTSGEFRFNY